MTAVPHTVTVEMVYEKRIMSSRLTPDRATELATPAVFNLFGRSVVIFTLGFFAAFNIFDHLNVAAVSIVHAVSAR